MSEKTELLIIEDGTKEKIWKHYDKTKQDIDRDIGILKEWLKQQPHLPDDEGNSHHFLLFFLPHLFS